MPKKTTKNAPNSLTINYIDPYFKINLKQHVQ